MAVGGGIAAYETLRGGPVPSPQEITSTSASQITQPTSTTSAQTLSDYLRSKGVAGSVADLASSYGMLDSNKKELGDYIIGIAQFTGGQPTEINTIERYQTNLLKVLRQEDPNDVSSARLGTLRYMFSDSSLAINMLEYCMYPRVCDYIDIVNSKYGDVDKRIVYATLGIPRFKQVDKNKDTFETVMQRGTDQQFKPAFNQMLSEGNVDKSKYSGLKRQRFFTAFCTPIESLVWELLDDDKKADSFLKHYDMKTLVSDAFRNTKASGNYGSEEWKFWDTAANRLGFNSWISWKWVKDNMMYDRSLAGKPHISRSPEDIYEEKLNKGIATGDCLHAAELSLDTLDRGAAKACILHIVYDYPSVGRQNHYVTLEYRNKSDIRIVMNFGFDGALPIIGPVKTESDAANATVGALGGGGVVRWISIEELVNWDL